MQPHDPETGPTQPSPIAALARGAAAGLAATLVLSALARVAPGIWEERGEQSDNEKPKLPEDRFDPEQVQRWQLESQCPAALKNPKVQSDGGAPAATPAGALTHSVGPGPEGLAEQFAFKLASGVFNQDISPAVRPVGMATHLTYGSAWGALYGLIQASYGLRPGAFGPLYGMVVYGVGPAFLVPAMKLMRPPGKEPPERTSMLILGHLVYGAALAQVFQSLQSRREERR